jgi:hypothetical protein
MGSSLVWVWWLVLPGVACQGESVVTTSCIKDTDCPGSQVCRLDPPSQMRRAATFPNPCLALRTCFDRTSCAPTEACGPNLNSGLPCAQNVCRASCETTGCSADEVCQASGLCGFRHCKEAGAPLCADPYRCDPAAVAPAQAPAILGGVIATPEAPVRAAQRGCVPKKCSEPGGFVCRDNWRCDAAVATDPSGCVPLPCTQTGKCTDDLTFICTPTNAGPHPPDKDVHGCVHRNCAESANDLCTYIMNGVDHSECDVTAPASVADTYGCVIRRCNERPSACTAEQRCDPAAPNANPLGCRPASCRGEGTVCTPPSTCDPDSPRSDVYGCRQPDVVPPGTGGRPGTGAASGAGGLTASGGVTASGGAMTSGGTGGIPPGTGGAASPMGVCVD